MSWIGNLVWKLLPWSLRRAECTHFEQATFFDAENEGCEECLKIDGQWVHLRRCLNCGKVGCCDDSPNTHARKHFEEDGHAVVRTVEPGETWVYCFADDVAMADVNDLA
jgi:uncharacterized UBP type Zn finger protein